MTESVVKSWIADIPFKMQVVLLSALRGCDGIPKEDISKQITRAFRSVLLFPAVTNHNDPNMFMSVDPDLDKHIAYFSQHLDHYPNHFVTHLIHAFEIVGYKHPDLDVRNLWFAGYKACAEGMHLRIEAEHSLDERLSGDYGPKIAAQGFETQSRKLG